MPRHRTIPSNRSKAVALIAAGAFCIAGAASAAATWTREPAQAPPGAAQAAAVIARPANAVQLLRPQASPQAVTLTVGAVRIGGKQATHAAVRRQDKRRQAQAAQSAASGSPEQIAQAMLRSFGWSSSQFACLYPLWEHESGWSVTAANPDGAYGVPQALPGSKMASAGPDWQTDAATQIRWGLEYIKGLYGSPCGAWAHEQATGWY